MWWGLEKMDECARIQKQIADWLIMCRLGIQGYLEASVYGKGLYEKCGFKVIRMLEFDARPWGAPYSNIHYVSIFLD